jgi:predicted acyl esterase
MKLRTTARGSASRFSDSPLAGEERPAFDEYVSDPGRPVPYYPRPISPLYVNTQWSEWLVQDQRFAQLRPDVVSYESEPLAQDIDVANPASLSC